MNRPFQIRRTARENIGELRRFLGSATRDLSRDDLARMVNAEIPSRGLTGSGIRHWEEGKGQPEYNVASVFARLAGVSFEAFCLGDSTAPPVEMPDPEKDRKLTPQEIARAQRQAEREKSEQRQRARGVVGKRPPRGKSKGGG